MDLAIRYFGLKKSTLFLMIISFNLLIAWLSRMLLVDEVVFYNTYSEQLTYERAMTIFEHAKRLTWLGYVVIPFALLIKFTLITIVINIGIFFLDNNNTVSFGEIFGVVIGSEVVFVTAGFIKFLWFCFFAGNYDLNELSFYFPLSLSNFFDYSEVDKIWIFPLQALNLFQIAYILLLSCGIQIRSGLARSKAEKSVLVSYVPGLFIVITLLMFLSLGTSI